MGKKWSSGCVHSERNEDEGLTHTNLDENNEVEENTNNGLSAENDNGEKNTKFDYAKNISKVVDALELSCGVKGLGRACQRIIDHGRKMFINEKLKFAQAEMTHYVH